MSLVKVERPESLVHLECSVSVSHGRTWGPGRSAPCPSVALWCGCGVLETIPGGTEDTEEKWKRVCRCLSRSEVSLRAGTPGTPGTGNVRSV